jgi:DNA-binding PadR family transcriptional regulator
MSLRYALLAILRVGPLSGYDLQKQFHQSVGHVWHAPDSQIYPELRKMEELGLIEGEEQARGERGTRRMYHVTDAGNRAFRDWMALRWTTSAYATPRICGRPTSRRPRPRRLAPFSSATSRSGRASSRSGRASSSASTPSPTPCSCAGSP